jgi:hypothetical protein
MNDSLTEGYLRWLGSQIRDEEQHPRYLGLFEIMFQKEFEWTVHNDENRNGDGLELRAEYCYAHHIREGSLRRLGSHARFLEVLIGLSRRLKFAAGGDAPGWAWTLVTNLELHKMRDPMTHRKADKVNDILDTVIWRTYNPDGCGGFFPLAWPDDDQTRVELWYQMAAFIDELHPEH